MKQLYSLILYIVSTGVFAQIGGVSSFQFLNVPANSRINALGGHNVSTYDEDVNTFLYNPASLNVSQVKNFSINYLPYYADIKKTSLAYALPSKKFGHWGVALQFLDYGKFDKYSNLGVNEGTFRANEYALQITQSHKLDNFSLGATFKLAASNIDTYFALGAFADIGGIWKHPTKDFTVGLSAKNLGAVIVKYHPDAQHSIPVTTELGASFKPEHMPVRFSLTVQNLHSPDVVYLDTNYSYTFDDKGNRVAEEKKLYDQFLRRFVLGTEFVFSKNFNLRAGYNFLRYKELRLTEFGGKAGLSIGMMLRVKGLEFNFAREYFHAVGGRSVITLTTNTDKIFRKKKVVSNDGVD